MLTAPGRAWLALLGAFALALPAAAPAGGRERWREAFQSSPADYDFVIPPGLQLPAEARERLRDRPPVTGTLRVRVAVAIGGRRIRIRLTNEEGSRPLVVAGASVGRAVGTGFDAEPAGLRRLTFGGEAGVTIAAGAPAISDPVDLPVTPQSQLVVSVTVPAGLKLKPFGSELMAMAPGDQTLAPALRSSDTIVGRPPVSGLTVLTAASPRIVVALGDSITDGNRPRPDALRGWPERLQGRIARGRWRDRLAVVNAGIGGNRVLTSSWGRSALARFDRDVARIEGVSHLILLEGINDIGFGGASTLLGVNPPLRPGDLIAGYRQIIARAHARGIRVVMGTLTPFARATSYTPEREAQRQAVNRWIRTAGESDGVIDFDAALRDPADATRLRAEYDSGDHLHPGPLGYAAMADAVDLRLLGVTR